MKRTIEPSKGIIRQQYDHLAREYPEYLELSALLSLAATTWSRFGVSASDLAQMDEMTVEMIRLLIGDK